MDVLHRIRGHDGVDLVVQDGGNPDGPPLLLIHGWSQSRLCWARQFRGELARDFRLIAPDLRGHGQSGRPAAASAYDNPAPWAGDIAAIIAALDLRRPVLAGWSMGGWVVQDYLAVHGDAALAGIALVGATVTSGAHRPAAARAARDADTAATALGMYSDDLAENIAATVAFVKACVAGPLCADDLAFMVGYNMLVPPHIRRPARGRSEDYRPVLARLRVPAAILWGRHERLVLPAMTEQARAALPRARAVCFEASGHAPFWEEPEAFDAALADFARLCAGMDAA